jgi:hypothetical protein
MATSDTTTPDPRRFPIRPPRLLWIGLGTSVLVVVAIGLGATTPIYRQHLAIREIKRLGGTVVTRPTGPQWLRDRVSKERMQLFDDVVGVHFGGTNATDTTLSLVGGLTRLERLFLDNTQVSDAGLAHLKGLTRLQLLSLDGTQVTDSGLVHVAGLTALQQLWLGDTRVTDAGLVPLRGLPNLQGLSLTNTPVTNAGVVGLQRALPGLLIRRPLPLPRDGILSTAMRDMHRDEKDLADARVLVNWRRKKS